MKKYCEKCGLRHDFSSREKTDQFICPECSHPNLGMIKKTLKEKTSSYEACPKCGMVKKGKVIRKINNVMTIEYNCEHCNFKWSEQWETKTLKDRLKNAVKKP